MSKWNSFVCVEEAGRDCVGIGGAWDKRFHCEETTDQSQVRMQRWPGLHPEVQALANTQTYHLFRNRAHKPPSLHSCEWFLHQRASVLFNGVQGEWQPDSS